MEKYCISCFAAMDAQAEYCPYCGCKQESSPKEKYHLAPMTLISGRYLLGRAAGSGGFGITYKAFDLQLQQIVAIKEFFPSGMVQRAPGMTDIIVFDNKKNAFEKEKQRFLTEARTIAKFTDNDNIVNVYNYFEENGTAYIVMEFLEGLTLSKYIEQCGGRLDLDTALDIIEHVLNALKSVHKGKIIHRDINPRNVMITTNNKIVLYDFGAARLSDDEDEKTRTIVLTPGYAPPEQYRAKSRQGPFTDIYAVGAMFYYMLTGTIPMESVDRAQEDEMLPPSKLVGDLPKYVDNAILKAMAIKHELRFKSADEFLDALRRRHEVLIPEEELKKRKRRRAAAASVISIILVCVLAYTGVMSWGLSNVYIGHIEPLRVLLVRPDGTDAGSDANMREAFLDNFRQYMQDNKFRRADEFTTENIEIDFAAPEAYWKTLQSGDYDVFVNDYTPADTYVESGELSFISKSTQPDMAESLAVYVSSETSLPTQFDFPVLYINMDQFDSTEEEAVRFVREKLRTDNMYAGCVIDPSILMDLGDGAWDLGRINAQNARASGRKEVLDTADCTALFAQGKLQAYAGKYSERDFDRRQVKNLLVVPLTLWDEDFESVDEIGMYSSLIPEFKNVFCIAADLTGSQKYEAMYFIGCMANANTQQMLSAYGYAEYLPVNEEVLVLSVNEPFLRDALDLDVPEEE